MKTKLDEVMKWFFFLVFSAVFTYFVVITCLQYPIVVVMSFASVFFGTGLNAIVRKLNEWKMPVKIFNENVRRDVLLSSGHCEMTDASRCRLLADRLYVPLGKSYCVFSIGDYLIYGGIGLLGFAIVFAVPSFLAALFL